MIKLQHMSVIFVIIMIPIILVLSFYIATQIDTINLQTQYNTKLNDATHDAMEAFQINTRNNEYSTVSDSLKRDVAASVNTFYTSLATNMGVSGIAREELQPYIPAVLCTMYDGFYLSSPTKTDAVGDAEDVLKQYTYYTARYINNDDPTKITDVTINYSLDSYISVYGTVNGKYVARSGYLIQYGANGLSKINNKDLGEYSVYNYSDEANYINSGKTYRIKDGMIWTTNALGKEEQVAIEGVVYNGQTIGVENNIVLKNENNQYQEKDNSREALYYFLEAYEFSRYMNEIDLASAINDAKEIRINDNTIWESGSANNKIAEPEVDFDGEDPENISSGFVNHKRDIIKFSIEDSLETAFNNFEGVTTYDYQLPKLKEEDWEKIYKNVSVVTFMQGIQVGSKLYNNYSVVTSTGNEEYIDPEEIYFINNTSTNTSYYRIDSDTVDSTDFTGYKSSTYLQQSKIIAMAKNDSFGNKEVYNGISYSEGDNIDKTGSGYILRAVAGKEITADYNSIVNANYDSVYNDDGVLLGDISDNNKKTVYYTALARERYCLKRSKTTSILNTTQTIRGDLYATGQVINPTTGKVNVRFSKSEVFPSGKYTLVSVKDKDGNPTNESEIGQKLINTQSELTLDLLPNQEYTVTVQATDKYGKIKTDTVKLNTGNMRINTETHWEKGYLVFTASSPDIADNGAYSISVNYTNVGSKGDLVGGLPKPKPGEDRASSVSIDFQDPQEVYENNKEFRYSEDYLTVEIKDATGNPIETQYTSPSGIDQEGPIINLEQEDINIEQDKISFNITADDIKSGFTSDSKFDIQIFEVGNENALEGITITGETTSEEGNYNQISQSIEITGLKPNTEYYLVIKISDRLGNETSYDTRENNIIIKTEEPTYEEAKDVPDAEIVINPDKPEDIDEKTNIIVTTKPTYWVDGEKEKVTVELETTNLPENEYYIEYRPVSDYQENQYSEWLVFEKSIEVSENSAYFVRLAKGEGEGKKVGQQTTFNIQNIDKQDPIISWWGNPDYANNKDVILNIVAKDEDSGLKTFKVMVDNQEDKNVPTLEYNQAKNEGTKEVSHQITVKENTTVKVQVEDCVGRKKEETIEIKNIDKDIPKVEIIGAENSNQIDKRYANKNAEIKIKVRAEDKNLLNKPIDIGDLAIKVGNQQLQLIGEYGEATEGKAYAYTNYTTEQTTDGVIIQEHTITLYNVSGNGALTIELKEGAIKDTAGNSHRSITYETGIIMDNIAPKMNLETTLENKNATIYTNSSDESSGIYQYQYIINDSKNLKDEIYEENGTDIYSFKTTFGIYSIQVEITDRAENKVVSNKELKDYDIATKEEMIYFQKYVNTGTTFVGETINLINDIDLEGRQNDQWEPIGNVSQYRFYGIFEGNGYTISNIYINNSKSYQGLFGYNNGTIKNLTIDGNIQGGNYTAGITACNYGGIENCINNVNITGKGHAIGGIVGGAMSNSTIKKSTNNGVITSNREYIGGIVGATYSKVSIVDCTNNGNISGRVSTGGIVGSIRAKTEIKRCANNAAIQGKEFTGGIAGINRANSIIAECYNIGEIKGEKTPTGGITGCNGNPDEAVSSVEFDKATIINCYNIGNVHGTQFHVGGIAGANMCAKKNVDFLKIENCYNLGKVTTDHTWGAAGITGQSDYLESITNCYYLEGVATEGVDLEGYTEGDQVGIAESKTVSEMQNPQFVKTLGIEAWKEDHTQEGRIQINDGYPILKWQEGKETVIVTVEETTFNSIQVSALVTNIEVANAEDTQYEYYIGDSENNYKLKETTTDKNYTFTGLKQKQTYYIKVVATNTIQQYQDSNNGIYEGKATATTGEFIIKEGDIQFKAVPSEWTNGNVTVSMTTEVEYTMQYKVGTNTSQWTNYSQRFEVEENVVIYGRFIDEVGNTSSYTTLNVTNIDKIKPTVEVVNVGGPNLYDEEEGPDSSWYDEAKTEYHLTKASEFIGFLNLVNSGTTFEGKTVYLDNHVDFGSIEYYSKTIGKFAGILDGGNYILDNLNITANGIFYSNSGTIKNLILGSNCMVTYNGKYDGASGALAFINSGTIENCYSMIKINSTTALDCGGLVWKNNGIIRNCAFMGHMNLENLSKDFGDMAVGGIASINDLEGTIQNCYNKGSIYAINQWASYGHDVEVGGIVGENLGTIEKCYNTGNLIGYEFWGQCEVGGIACVNDLEGTVQNCYNTGSISFIKKYFGIEYGMGWGYGAGIVQYNDGKIKNCYNTGVISGFDRAIGPIVQNNFYGVASYVNTYYLEGTVSTEQSYGGTRLTSEYMKSTEFVTNLADDVWQKDTENINNGYPIFKWQENAYEVNTEFESKVSIQIQDKESGIAYWGVTTTNSIPADKDVSTEENITSTNKVGIWYPLTNTTDLTNVEFLTSTKGKYYVWVKDLVGNINQNINPTFEIDTGEDVIKNDIVFSNQPWENGLTSIDVSTQQSGLQLQISTDNQNWINTTEKTYIVTNLNHEDIVYAKLTDGEYTSKISWTYVLDNKPPESTITVTGTKVGETTTEGNEAEETETIDQYQNATVTVSTIEKETGLDNINVHIDKEGSEYYQKTYNYDTYNEKFEYKAELTEYGLYTITMTATDKAGNITETSKKISIIDTIKPTAEVISIEETEIPADIYNEEEGPDTSWYDETKTEIHLTKASQFIGFLNLTKEGNTFEGKTIYLENNMDFNGYEFKKNFKSHLEREYNTFSGILDGNGHVLENLRFNIGDTPDVHPGSIIDDKNYNVGLFDKNLGTIQNLTLGSNSGVFDNNNDNNLLGLGYKTHELNINLFVGYNEGIIKNCYNLAFISVSFDGDVLRASGFVGTNVGTIQNCYNLGTAYVRTTEPMVEVAGIANFNRMGLVQNCFNLGKIDVYSTYSNHQYIAKPWMLYVGGIVANNSYGGSIEKCYNSGAVKADVSEDVLDNDGKKSKVIECGGIAGYNGGTIIKNCYNTGSDAWGGIAGYNSSPIQNCYNTGIVKASIVYKEAAYKGDEIQNCYYLADNVVVQNYASPRTASQMKLAEFVTTLNNNDTNGVWKQDTENINNGYPILNWQEDVQVKVDEESGEVKFDSNIQTKANIQIQDKESGIKYWAVTTIGQTPVDIAEGENITSITETGKWYPVTNTTEPTNVEFTTRTKGTYYVWVQDAEGNINEETTFEVTKGKDRINNDVVFSTPTWENGLASIEVSTQQTDLQLQISTDNKNWTSVEGNAVEITNLKNEDIVYAKLTDGTYESDISYITILDTKPPESTISIVGTMVETTETEEDSTQEDTVEETETIDQYQGSVTVTVSTIEKETGLDNVNVYIDKDGSEYHKETNNYDTYNETFTNTDKPITLKECGLYTITITATDKAGNMSETSKKISIIDIIKPTAEVISIEETEIPADVYNTEEGPDTSWYDETKTEFHLTEANQFIGFLNLVNSGTTFEAKNVYLENDMDFGNIEHNVSAKSCFHGNLDGKNYILDNLQLIIIDSNTDDEDNSAGLFSVNYGTIQNLILGNKINVVDNGYGRLQEWSGSIAVTNEGTIKNCYNMSGVIINGSIDIVVGGLVAENRGIIENCYNIGEIKLESWTGTKLIGGIAAVNRGMILNCSNAGDITVLGESAYDDSCQVGGIAYHNAGTIQDSCNIGDITLNTNLSKEYGGRNCLC